MTDYRCPCCNKKGLRSKFRNLRVQCYKEERRQAGILYRQKKRERERKIVPEMAMNDAAIAWLNRRIVSEVFPCHLHG
jgi:hypothetical protein